jgi:hypothetical protein
LNQKNFQWLSPIWNIIGELQMKSLTGKLREGHEAKGRSLHRKVNLKKNVESLLDTGPCLYTEFGWQNASVEERAGALMADVADRLEGAAQAIFGQIKEVDPGRALALRFTAKSIQDQAKMLRRIRSVVDLVAEVSASEAA